MSRAWWILVLLYQWTQLAVSRSTSARPLQGVGPIRMLEELDLVEPDTGFDERVVECVADAADRRGDPTIDERLGEADRRVLRRFKLAHRGKQFAACLLAAATNLSANTGVVVVGRVAIALLGASTTCDNTCLDRGAYDADIRLGLTGHDPARRVAHACTVKAEPNAPHQLGHVRLAEAGVSAAGARGGTLETLVNAAQEDVAIKADGPRMSLDDFSDSHVASVPVGILRSSGELAIPPLRQRHLWRSRRLHRQYGQLARRRPGTRPHWPRLVRERLTTRSIDAVMVRTGREGDRLARLSHLMAVGHAAQDCRGAPPSSVLDSHRRAAG